MRKLFLISVLVVAISFKVFPQPQISVLCDETWGPGRYNKVTCTINIPGSFDFARFTQDFPVGIEAVNDNTGGGDFNWISNQLNIVWMRIPESRIITFSYFTKPDKSMSGSFSMTGRLISVSGGTARYLTYMQKKNISIEGLNGVLPEKLKSGSIVKTELLIGEKPKIRTVGQKSEITFRIQLLTSSTSTTEREFLKKLDMGRDIGVRIIQSGKIYKYQAGSFQSYDSANKFLKQVIIKGYKDAFVVAYSNNEQIPVDKALNYLK